MNKITPFLVLMCCLVAPYLSAKAPAKDEIKVISYNIRLIHPKDGANEWKYRAKASPAMIKDHAPDIFGVQEALQEQLMYMDKNLKQYSYVGVGREDGVSEGEHMAMFYNKRTVKLLDWGTFWLSQTPEKPSKGWDAKCKRTATWALMELKDSGRKFYYVNTHLDHRGKKAQRKGLDLIVNKIAEINPEKLPMILTGDFNITPDNSALKELNTKMVEARTSAKKTDSRATFNGWGSEARKIDYIYYSGFSDCTEYETIVKQYKDIPYISDHYPIRAVITF